MDVFFADDSTQKGRRAKMKKLIAFGGLLLRENKLVSLQREVDEICKSFGIPDEAELKWSPRKTDWIYHNLIDDKRRDCYLRILQTARECDGRAVVVIWSTGYTTLQYPEAFSEVLKYLFERVTMHLEYENQVGLIVADQPGGGVKEEAKLLREFLKIVRSGTEFVNAKRVVLNVLTTSSALVRQLQVADLIVGITTAVVAGRAPYAEPLFKEIIPMFIQNSEGYVGGTGLKLFPDELINLYYWVLGEKAFCRIGIGAGCSLPREGSPYCCDEFIA